MSSEIPAQNMKGLVFGFGRMGITHIALLNRYAKNKIEWDVYDPSWKTRFLVWYFGDLAGVSFVSEQTIKEKEYDMAVICSPPQFHQSNYDLIKGNTKKVFVEKPGFVSSPNVDNVCVGYVLRHSPCVSKLCAEVEGKQLSGIKIDIRSNTVIEDGSGWRASSKGGGVVNEFGSHAINLAKLIAKDDYVMTNYETGKVVSSDCPDTCSIDGITKNSVKVEIKLNWSDESVRKPTYKIIAVFADKSELHTDLYQIWKVNEDGESSDVSGVAYWDSNCEFYVRGLEFSEQAKYFVTQEDFSRDLNDSIFTDQILKEFS